VKHRYIHATLLALLLASSHATAHSPAGTAATAQIPAEVSSPAWEEDIRKFTASDAIQPPPKHGVLFIGSSSIRFWQTLASDFPHQQVINRGFGGSELRDSTWYADRIVVPYAPRLIVLYAGDNDLNSGRSAEQVRDDFVAFVQRVRGDLPDTHIAYLSIKPSPSRAQLMPAALRANALIRSAAASLPQVDYIDVYTPMLGADGKPRAELFGPDRLHMTAAGYALWRDIVGAQLQLD
jgi:lysophospholipase L1-like esterase